MSVTARLDRLPLSSFHLKTVLVIGIAWMFGGSSLGMVSFVFPVLVEKWKLAPDAIGVIGMVQSLGMFAGSILAGTLSDRYGRKGIFQIVTIIFTVANGLSGLAVDAVSLGALRFLVGFGLGGMFPVAPAILSEFAPSKYRGLLMVAFESFWAYGSILAVVLAYLTIPSLGWEMAFFISGLPVVYVIVMNRMLIESPRHLLTKGRTAEAEALIHHIETSYYSGDLPAVKPGLVQTNSSAANKVALGDLLRPPLLKRTICLWVVNFAMVFTYFGVFIWLPTLLVKSGHELAQSLVFILVISLGQVPGYFVVAYLLDRLGRKLTLLSALLLYGIAAYFFGQSSSGMEIIFWGFSIAFLNAGVYGTVYTYTPELYPTWARGTGTGAAVAAGRIGAILGPLAVAWMIGGWSDGYTLVFAVFAAVLIVAALTVLAFGEETMGRSLEEITSQ